MGRGRWIGAALAVMLGLLLAGCQSATVLQNGTVLLVSPGGAAIYDPVAGTITPTGAPIAMRVAGTSTLLGDGSVLFAGGAADTTSLADVERYDPTTGTFAPAGDLTEGRALHTATLLHDGHVLLTGGGVVSASSSGGESPPPLTTAELFDPATGISAATGSMGSPRAMHVATLLADGSVLLTGGSGGSAALATAERFDPASGTFAPAGTMSAARALHTATLLGDGSVIVIGGLQPGPTESSPPVLLDTIERYDPGSETFTTIGSLGVPRAGHTATLLTDGRILVAGGVNGQGGGLATAELVDPATGTSVATGDLVQPRGLHSAALLVNGEVLLVGGELAQTGTDPAHPVGIPEIYSPATGTFRAVTP